MLASIIIRTLNEAEHLDALLCAIENQNTGQLDYEIILVDSGSKDDTVPIAALHGCKIIKITREEFSFGRALNLGCEAANGEFLVMISGHCVPTDQHWLQKLCGPLIQQSAEYTYGRQLGGDNSHFSECQIFSKHYPEQSAIPQEGFFCNNANAAITSTAWAAHRFDEDLTGLEDMELAKRLTERGGNVAYVAEASVYHHHDESWKQVKRRFEREALALQQIMPQIHIHTSDWMRYIISSIWLDWKKAVQEKVFFRKAIEIVQYRFFQYWGSFVGNHDHRKLSHAQKEVYFFPTKSGRKHES